MFPAPVCVALSSGGVVTTVFRVVVTAVTAPVNSADVVTRRTTGLRREARVALSVVRTAEAVGAVVVAAAYDGR